MHIPFYKFDGAGNDFVVIDNREGQYTLGTEEIARICHRRFGVGADGLMMLSLANGYDFRMDYYNSDGRLGSMCGNGGRCIAAFAHHLGLGSTLRFVGYDGPHEAYIQTWDGHRGMVRLGMRSIAADSIRQIEGGWFLDTGSPHFVLPVSDLEHYDVFGEGRRWRNRTDLFPEGTNVDFIEPLPDGSLSVRTYERGVEDETWACGTGVTACAIVSGTHLLIARGGPFYVEFSPKGSSFENVHLTGPVALNFSGEWPMVS
jgi:diaminopimelate epimerase